jgi:FAD/FMN-containing dehydrogenase
VRLESWGRFPRGEQRVVPLHWAGSPWPEARPLLAHGLGRSYGDACLNHGGTLLTTRGLDHFIALDEAALTITCEAGVSLAEILALVVPRGLFLPVVPGTKQVTVGGAIANDVHGKNHHREGTFGRHVVSLELLRSDGRRRTCSPSQEPALFNATVGGLGLTGLILAATLRLRRVPSAYVEAESLPVRDLDHFFELSARSDETHEYTVAWIDCLASGARAGRGILHRANAAEAPGRPRRMRGPPRLSIPCELPFSPLNRLSVAAFNLAYHAANARKGRRLEHVEPYFFPLDGVGRWNRIYGPGGLLQFQCAIPREAGPATIRRLLGLIAASGEGSFLAVLKGFGDVASPGLLSFPRPGVTLAMDFAYRGERTDRLFRVLHAVTEGAGGALYPAKDAHMSPAAFRRSYPRLREFEPHLDPAFSSSFWRRVTSDG